MSHRISRVARNATSNVGRFAMTAVVHFLLTPFVVHHLGADGYGLWSLAFAILGFVGLLDFGLGTAVLKETARFGKPDDRGRRNRALSTLAIFYIGLALVAFAAVAVLAEGAANWFDLDQRQAEQARKIVWILGLRTALVALPLGFFRSVLFGEQRISSISAVQIVSVLVYSGGAWLTLAHGHDVVALAWLNLACGVAEHITYLVLAHRLVPGLKLRLRSFDRKIVPDLASFSGATFLISISALVLLRTDPLIIKFGLSLSAVALYAVALKVVENGHLLVKQFINVLAPFAAQLHAQGETTALRAMIVDVARHSLWFGSLLAAGVLSLGEALLVVWIGPDFSEAAPAMSILMVSVTLLIPQMVAANVLTMTGQHRTMAFAAIMGVIINVGASVSLVSHLGLEGVALGTLIATLLVDSGYVLWRACKLQGLGYLRYLWTVHVPALVCGGAQFVMTFGVRELSPPTSLAGIALVGLPGVSVSVALYILFFLTPPERTALKRFLTRRSKPDVNLTHQQPTKKGAGPC